MRYLLIFAVAAVFVAVCQSLPRPLQCYRCHAPSLCLKKRENYTVIETCPSGPGWNCLRAQRKTLMPDADPKPEPGDDFKTLGGAIFGRSCRKKADCEKEAKKSKLMSVTCCDNKDLCNA